MTFLDLFAGIGGFRSGLEAVGGFQCVGYCEIDSYPRRAYEALYDTREEMYFPDARTIDPAALPDLDLICGGFPCQSYPEKSRPPEKNRAPRKKPGGLEKPTILGYNIRDNILLSS